MDVKRKSTTSGILALLAATVVACGSLSGAAQRAGSGSAGSTTYVAGTGGGTTYLMADSTYGTGAIKSDRLGSDPDAAPPDGYCPREWCPPLEP